MTGSRESGPSVAILVTCLANQFFASAVADCVRVLEGLGCTVRVPASQTCCGQPAFNAGHSREARQIAEHTAGVFAGSDFVIAPSGSCASMIRTHYPHLPPHGPGWTATATALAQRTYELSEFLVDVLEVSRLGAGLDGRAVVVHPGCHGLRDLGLERQALHLLQESGARVLPWSAAHECCGFGGLFAAKMAPVSLAMADRKLDSLPEGGRTLTSMDAGCLLQLGGRVRHRGMDVNVVHLATLYAEAASVRP